MKSISIALALLSTTLSIGGPASILSNTNNISFNNELKFDNTNVLDDLLSSDNFNILDYPYKENEGVKIINFVEYEYSFYSNLQSNYSLYIYLYNPGNLNIDVNSSLNKIQLATHWNDNHYPDNYEKFNLKFLSKSEDSTHYNLFYKFKIDLSDSEKASLLNNLNSNERRYDVSGIELFINNEQDVIEYSVGGTYKFTGFSEGLGSSKDDTLSCEVTDLETIDLEVHPTYYRLDSSSKGKNYKSEIDSVYFSIPNYYLETYGNLQKIKAEWYEYKTSPIFVIDDLESYNKLKNIQGIYVDSFSWDKALIFNSSSPVTEFDSTIGVGETGLTSSTVDEGAIVFNMMGKTGQIPSVMYYNYYIKAITWLFYTDGIDYSNYEIEANELLDFANSYTFFNEGINEIGLSKELFKGKVEEGRTEGYNLKEFDASEDSFNLLNYDENVEGWKKFLDYFLNWSNIPDDSSIKDIAPIVNLNEYSSSNELFSDDILVNNNDLDELKSTFESDKSSDKSTFLFRFATNDYYSSPVYFNDTSGQYRSDSIGYVAKASMFANFDIITLTFNKEGKYTVIPVVHDPIDIIGDITPPPKTSTWWERLLQILIGVGILGLSIYLIVKLIKAIGEYSRS